MLRLFFAKLMNRRKLDMKISFKNRIIGTVALSCIICTAAAVYVSSKRLESEGRNHLIEKSRAILSRIEVGSHYVARMKTLDGVIEETRLKYPDGVLPEDQKMKILRSVPIYAAFEIGKQGAKEENYTFRIASDAPRQKANLATEDERIIINQFRDNPQLKENIQESKDNQFILVSRPVRISEERGCLTCHGDPSTSPWKNGKDILGYQMENMKDGDLRATFIIISSLEPIRASAKASTMNIIMWGALITLLAMLFGFVSIRKPVANLTQFANDLSKTADEVAFMSSEIASTSAHISSGAVEQASALEETSASMEEMSAMVSRNSEGADRSRGLANQSQNTAEQGKNVVQEMIHSINEIDKSNAQIMNQIEDSNRQISDIVQIIAEIGNKTKVINEIVFQTKLLSFNASVEAARAGEQGKGFAVVAEEVGNLARMSGNAAADITQMLDSSLYKVEGIVNETKSKVEVLIKVGKEKVEKGTEVARECEAVLHEIVQNVQSVSAMVEQIAEGSHEQSKGVSEINKALVQLNTITQQNTGAAQESSFAAEKLSSQADLLRQIVQSVIATMNGAEVELTDKAQPKASRAMDSQMANKRKHLRQPSEHLFSSDEGGEDAA